MKPRLLIFEMRMMGDAIMSLPFIRAAGHKFEVHVGCAPGGEEVFQMVLPPERVIAWNPPWLAETQKYALGRYLKSGLHGFLRHVRCLRAEVTLSVWPDARTHILMALSGARERVGYPMAPVNYYANHLSWRRRQLRYGAILAILGSVCLGRPLLTRKLLRRDYRQHHLENWRQLADALEVRWDVSPPWIVPSGSTLPPAVTASLDQAREAGRQVWLVHPGARLPNRRWPWANFRRVIEEVLLPAGAAVMVVQPPELAGSVRYGAGAGTLAPGNLGELARIMSGVDHVLCNDTGVAHLAAALGKRTVAVFTANLPQWFAPHGNLDLAVDHTACPIRPCLDRCVMASYVCCEAVTVDMVAAQVRSVLKSNTLNRGGT